jgi:hypothetical protein
MAVAIIPAATMTVAIAGPRTDIARVRQKA